MTIKEHLTIEQALERFYELKDEDLNYAGGQNETDIIVVPPKIAEATVENRELDKNRSATGKPSKFSIAKSLGGFGRYFIIKSEDNRRLRYKQAKGKLFIVAKCVK
ncbi:hypothetical protein NPIL_160281 [Nephila pilipes]|uniref:Uncharacterized protein n=1 Tax=Nephila pilipes TaxID=299642 RepID=A0A8X6U0N6_NEPPI|nr:hypothetical protein NPIL_160281 [Nephila pilipes]